MRWFLPWTLAVVTAAAVGSALATVSPAWRGSERGPSRVRGAGRGGKGKAQGEEEGCRGQQIPAGPGQKGNT